VTRVLAEKINHQEHGMIKKETFIAATIISVSIPTVNLIGQLVHFTDLWPGFFVVLLYFIGKNTKLSDIKEVAAGGLVGLFWAWWVDLGIAFLIPYTGFLVALSLMVGGSCFLLIILGDLISPVPFNNYAFIYFLTAALFPEQKTLAWAGSLVVTGTLFAFLVLGSMKLLLKAPPQE